MSKEQFQSKLLSEYEDLLLVNYVKNIHEIDLHMLLQEQQLEYFKNRCKQLEEEKAGLIKTINAQDEILGVAPKLNTTDPTPPTKRKTPYPPLPPECAGCFYNTHFYGCNNTHKCDAFDGYVGRINCNGCDHQIKNQSSDSCKHNNIGACTKHNYMYFRNSKPKKSCEGCFFHNPNLKPHLCVQNHNDVCVNNDYIHYTEKGDDEDGKEN